MIHLKDYIDSSNHQLNSNQSNSNLEGNKIISFPVPNKVSREYIGRFVDQLMEMSNDPHHDFLDDLVQVMEDPSDVVATRILREEKW